MSCLVLSCLVLSWLAMAGRLGDTGRSIVLPLLPVIRLDKLVMWYTIAVLYKLGIPITTAALHHDN